MADKPKRSYSKLTEDLFNTQIMLMYAEEGGDTERAKKIISKNIARAYQQVKFRLRRQNGKNCFKTAIYQKHHLKSSITIE